MALIKRGSFIYRREGVRVSQALGGYEVGVERPKPGATEVRVWFHRLLLGYFRPGAAAGRRETVVEPHLELASSPYVALIDSRTGTGGTQCQPVGNTSNEVLLPSESGEGGAEQIQIR